MLPSAQPSLSPSRRPSNQPTFFPSRSPTRQPTFLPVRRPTYQPQRRPTIQPSVYPSCQPSKVPILRPSVQPTKNPAGIPTLMPSIAPSILPSSYPSGEPSEEPNIQPSSQPSERPTLDPTSAPTFQPSIQPTYTPSNPPSQFPLVQPSSQPSGVPNLHPSRSPSLSPSRSPSMQPSQKPSAQSIDCPSSQPLLFPSAKPISNPSMEPSTFPSLIPTSCPSSPPKNIPSSLPSFSPQSIPTAVPSLLPVISPSSLPSGEPLIIPTRQPSALPSLRPQTFPTKVPLSTPTIVPTIMPTVLPTLLPVIFPSLNPTVAPTITPTNRPRRFPSNQPSRQPKKSPSLQPVKNPTVQPSRTPVKYPSSQPKLAPSMQPTILPSKLPSRQPVANLPTKQPNSHPSCTPSYFPTYQPYCNPSSSPSMEPSREPSLKPYITPSKQPTKQPVIVYPTSQPLIIPLSIPSKQPTRFPSCQPFIKPSRYPSSQPSFQPYIRPSLQPRVRPSHQPVRHPTSKPSKLPSMKPTFWPTLLPSDQPIHQPSSQPTIQPKLRPSIAPTIQPSNDPSCLPSHIPTRRPFRLPSKQPVRFPSRQPTAQPARHPSRQPSLKPTKQSSNQPSKQPSKQPSYQPTCVPTRYPTAQPLGRPTKIPSNQPLRSPNVVPTVQPSKQPSKVPSRKPTKQPTSQPKQKPTCQPFKLPTRQPSSQPLQVPLTIPTAQPIVGSPSKQPSKQPIILPSLQPQIIPSSEPSLEPSILPSSDPSTTPSCQPTNPPTLLPLQRPSTFPSVEPSDLPTIQPHAIPSFEPSIGPTLKPSDLPTMLPSSLPSSEPSGFPSLFPSARSFFMSPTNQPSYQPECTPTNVPIKFPVCSPSIYPSLQQSAYSISTCKPSSNSPSTMEASPVPLRSTFSPTNITVPSLFPSAVILVPILQTQTQTQMPITSSPTQEPTLLASQSQSQSPFANAVNSVSLNQVLITAQSLYSSLASNCSHNTYCSYFEEVLFDGGIKLGGDSAFTEYLESELKNLQLQSSVNSIAFFRQSSFSPMDKFSTTRCLDANVARKIVSRMINYYDYVKDKTPTVYICAGDNWILQSCGAKNDLKLCINCFDPCMAVSVNPSAVFPFMGLSSSWVGILQVGFEDYDLPARVLFVKPSYISEQQISINISLSDFSYVYCMEVQGQSPINPSVQVLLSHHSQIAVNNMATYSFYNLIPSTSYSIYCITQSQISRVLPSEDMFQTVVRTDCCKKVHVSVTTPYTASQVLYFGILQVKFSAAPAVSVSLQADFLGQPTIKSCNFSTLFITNTSFTSADHPYLVSLQCSRPLMVGNYFISIFLDGYSASEYILNGDDDLAVSVISKNVSVSVPPSFFSATFDNSGTSLIIQFTSATNKALLPDIFACRDLLLFSNVDRSKCRWLDGATIKVQLIGGLAPTVGSFIFVSKSEHVMKLIAACPVHHDCSKWKSILDDSRVQILGPKNPIQPIVVAIGPAEIDTCSSVVIDLSPSSGSAGRQWLNFTVTVSSLSTDGSLSGLLSTVERIASDSAYNNSYLAVQLPAGLLYAITTYSFHFVACNWMQRCSGATYFITKYNRSTSVPTTSIAGPTVRYINVYNDLILNAIVHANPCADSTVTQISWKILLAGIELDVINHSNESSKFYLPGYSLKMNSQYLVRLVVTIPLTFEVFTYTVQVIVNARTYADVVPIIQQGSAISLSAGQSIFLNGNLSFDRTLSPKFQSKDTSLVFSWSCNALSSNVSNSCNFLAILPGKTGSRFSSVLVTANSAAIGSIFSVTMTISKGSISNQASIKLHIVQFLDNSCTVEINPLKYGGSNVFIGQKLKLISGGAATSSKNLSWSVTNLDVNAISAGATSRLFQVSKANSILQPFNFDLSVLANSFSFGITYTFTLSCISLNSDSSEIVPYASIDIFPNQPPIPGIFIVFPQSGVELIDMFGLYALYWYSEHIPLYYQFGFISPGTGYCLEAQHKSEVSYAFKAFPSGHPSKSYLLRITLDVFDSIGSNYSIFNDTTVLPSQQSLLTISSAISALNKSLDGPHETMYKLSMYSTRFNRANCSISPNCSLLNRQSCLNTDYTCGPCLVSFTGQSGDSNTKCTQTISSQRKLLSDANSSFCRNDNDCDAFQQCIEGVCVNSQQDCPNMCSQHGNCSFVLTKTGLPTKTCTYYDTSCTSICSCAYGYSGVACAQTSVQLATSIGIRCSMVRSLWMSIQKSNVDGDSISNWINLVNSLSFNAGEISACKFTVYEILQYIINYSLIVHMPYESMQLLSQTFDRLLTFTDMYLETIALIEKWSTTISSDTVVSQSVQSIEQHFRTLTISSVTKKEQIILEPVHGNETPTNFAVLNTLPSNVDDWITYTMIESQAALIESFEVNSNQITLIPNSFSSTVPFKVTISFANNNAVNDSKIFQSSNFSTACEANELTNHTYSCPVGPSTITARCSGTESIIHSYCPAYRYSTFCESISPTSGGVQSCRKVYPASVDRTICECLIYNDSSHLKFHISLAAGLRTELLYIPPTITIIKGP